MAFWMFLVVVGFAFFSTPADAGLFGTVNYIVQATATFGGHYYELIKLDCGSSCTMQSTQGRGRSWSRTAVDALGRRGYLANVATLAERDALAASALGPMFANKNAWLGIVQNQVDPWTWADGPEAGLPFWHSAGGALNGQENIWSVAPSSARPDPRWAGPAKIEAATTSQLRYFVTEWGSDCDSFLDASPCPATGFTGRKPLATLEDLRCEQPFGLYNATASYPACSHDVCCMPVCEWSTCAADCQQGPVQAECNDGGTIRTQAFRRACAGGQCSCSVDIMTPAACPVDCRRVTTAECVADGQTMPVGSVFACYDGNCAQDCAGAFVEGECSSTCGISRKLLTWEVTRPQVNAGLPCTTPGGGLIDAGDTVVVDCQLPACPAEGASQEASSVATSVGVALVLVLVLVLAVRNVRAHKRSQALVRRMSQSASRTGARSAGSFAMDTRGNVSQSLGAGGANSLSIMNGSVMMGSMTGSTMMMGSMMMMPNPNNGNNNNSINNYNSHNHNAHTLGHDVMLGMGQQQFPQQQQQQY